MLKVVPAKESFNISNCHPKLIKHLAEGQCENLLKNTFTKKLKNLSAVRFYTDRIIYLDHPNKADFNRTFYWRSLVRIKNLTNLELGFHIPQDFGTKVLRRLRYLEILKLHMYSGVDEHLFKWIKNLNNLKELTILKTYVNDDLTTYLPQIHTLRKVTIMIRAPCDTSYYYLLKTILRLKSTIEHFEWVVNDTTVSNVFFGKNCQSFLNIQNTFLFDKNIIGTCLNNLFLPVKTSFLLADSEYFPKLQRDFKECFLCAAEKVVFPKGVNIDIEDDLCEEQKIYESTYDIGVMASASEFQVEK